MDPGVVVDAQRPTTFPSLSIKNFSKFHYGQDSVRGRGGQTPTRVETRTHLDPRQAQDTCFLTFEPLVNLVRLVTVDLRFGHEGESYAMVELAELGNTLVVSWFLATELSDRGS